MFSKNCFRCKTAGSENLFCIFQVNAFSAIVGVKHQSINLSTCIVTKFEQRKDRKVILKVAAAERIWILVSSSLKKMVTERTNYGPFSRGNNDWDESQLYNRQTHCSWTANLSFHDATEISS